jgi:hypothetical protein
MLLSSRTRTAKVVSAGDRYVDGSCVALPLAIHGHETRDVARQSPRFNKQYRFFRLFRTGWLI